MSTPTLSRITLETIENYQAAATQGVAAYRLGGHRLMHAVNGVLHDDVYAPTTKFVPRTLDRLNDLRGRFSRVVYKGIDQMARNTEKAIELTSTTAAAQVSKLAKMADGIDNEIVATGLHTVVRLTMPGAKVALALSGKVAEGAQALADAAGGREMPAAKAVRKAVAGVKRQAAPATRKARATAQATGRRVAKAVEAVKAPAAKVRRAARSAK